MKLLERDNHSYLSASTGLIFDALLAFRKPYNLLKILFFMEVDMNTLHGDMKRIERELALIKNMLLAEGELSDWARSELENARNEDPSSYTDLEEI